MSRLVKLISCGLFAFGVFMGTYGWCMVEMESKSWTHGMPIVYVSLGFISLLTYAILDEKI